MNFLRIPIDWETYVWGGVLGGVLKKEQGYFKVGTYPVPLVDCQIANLEGVLNDYF